jgi:hypothetical protein
MNNQKSTGRLPSFKSHWKDFKKAFKDAFMDIAESVKAKNDLKSLRMQGSRHLYCHLFKATQNGRLQGK